jgi:PAS domain S-box-containing protein
MLESHREVKPAPSVQPLFDPSRHNHIVQFYDREEFLADRVVEFLSAGLSVRLPVVLIVTPEHRALFTERLLASGMDTETAERAGNLTILDARATLSQFMVGTMPDWDRFKLVVGGAIERALLQSPSDRIRAYGEMVDVLWREGNPQAAIRLEEFWNDAAKIYSFSLLCAYRMGNFYKEADGAQFDHVCRTHTHVIPAESYPQSDEDDARLREITLLQQRARALENEVAHRKQLEDALRIALREQRASAAALRSSEEKLKDFVENGAECLHWVGADGIIQWANKAELELLGYTAAEYVGRPIREFYEDRAVIDDILARLARNETVRGYEARMRCKDGTLRDVMINSNVCWDEDGTFEHTRCFTRDITERKQAEEKLRQAEAERAHLLKLEKAARADAEAATRAKDEFLAMLGHELRNPLSPIVTALQLMRLRGDHSSPRERAVIERQVAHLVRLVDDLLDVSRITGGKVELHREPVEIADVIAKAVEMVGPLLEQKSHHLVVDVPRGRGLRLDADPGRLAQVFCNLLANAAKYTDRRGRITVSAARQGESVVVRVADNGVGIDAGLLPQVFDIFTQAKQTLDRSQGGLGLGLTIVRSLVSLHGGKVSARSDGVGRGSEFIVELPLLLGPESTPADPVPSETGIAGRAWRSLRVLVVDDNEDAAMLIAESLRELGYEVREARDGPEAVRAAAEFLPDVAIVDIGLPVMDGYEVARSLRGSRPDIRLIALSGYGQDSDQARSRDAGFERHLVKPLALERLAAALLEFERQHETAKP